VMMMWIGSDTLGFWKRRLGGSDCACTPTAALLPISARHFLEPMMAPERLVGDGRVSTVFRRTAGIFG
jgi:hypothetical protein